MKHPLINNINYAIQKKHDILDNKFSITKEQLQQNEEYLHQEEFSNDDLNLSGHDAERKMKINIHNVLRCSWMTKMQEFLRINKSTYARGTLSNILTGTLRGFRHLTNHKEKTSYMSMTVNQVDVE